MIYTWHVRTKITIAAVSQVCSTPENRQQQSVSQPSFDTHENMSDDRSPLLYIACKLL